jgi:hypothetical protein
MLLGLAQYVPTTANVEEKEFVQYEISQQDDTIECNVRTELRKPGRSV